LGLGFVKEDPPQEGLSRTGAIRIEILLFPRVQIPDSAALGHTEGVTAGSQ
jgi:hypothetical protein